MSPRAVEGWHYGVDILGCVGVFSCLLAAFIGPEVLYAAVIALLMQNIIIARGLAYR